MAENKMKEVAELLGVEIDKPILSDSEKDYLENVLKPFKDRILFAKKTTVYDTNSDYEYVYFKVVTPDNEDYNYLVLPYFIKGTMYKEMKHGEQYSLEKLGLFGCDGE